MKTEQANIGYKAFMPTEHGFKTKNGDQNIIYEIGKTYETKESLEICKQGFHYCIKVDDVLHYYKPFSVITIIEILGDSIHDKDKSCTDKYRIVDLFDGQITDINGDTFNYKNGMLYREDNLPVIYYKNGRIEWYKNGLLHRDDGPAVIASNGFQYWYRNGIIHRADGPAVIDPNGPVYWLNNGKFTEKNFNKVNSTKKKYDKVRKTCIIL